MKKTQPPFLWTLVPTFSFAVKICRCTLLILLAFVLLTNSFPLNAAEGDREVYGGEGDYEVIEGDVAIHTMLVFLLALAMCIMSLLMSTVLRTGAIRGLFIIRVRNTPFLAH